MARTIKLTKKYCIANKFTPIDCVRYFKPKITNKEADFILFELTCFPLSISRTIKQLNDIFINNKNG